MIAPEILLALFALLCAAAGAAIALGIAHWRGLFNRPVNIVIMPASDTTPLHGQRTAEQVIVVRPHVTIDWHVLSQAAAANGWSIVPHEFVRPPS